MSITIDNPWVLIPWTITALCAAGFIATPEKGNMFGPLIAAMWLVPTSIAWAIYHWAMR